MSNTVVAHLQDDATELARAWLKWPASSAFRLEDLERLERKFHCPLCCSRPSGKSKSPFQVFQPFRMQRVWGGVVTDYKMLISEAGTLFPVISICHGRTPQRV